ncbi:MAG TPA: alkaline phosphatase PhoX [Mariprofundaceae bacterium]|nr:alkaline phosphatase PhoX [Mariprofundaceae bacterium]
MIRISFFSALLAFVLQSHAQAGESISFTATATDLSVAERTIPYTASTLRIADRSGKTAEYPLKYHSLFHTDDMIPSGPNSGQYFGGLVGADGNALMDDRGQAILSDVPDGNAIVPDGQGSLRMLTHFEYASMDSAGRNIYRQYPMFVGVSKLEQNRQNGRLNLRAFAKRNYRVVDGIWTPCVLTVSAWGSQLSAEENEPDARLWAMGMPGKKEGLAAIPFMKNYLNEYPVQASTPYHYGHMLESLSGGAGTESIVRHYSMGRFSHEKIEIMPDGRTSYMTDDKPFAAFFMAVADTKGDLSANTLYAARWEQTSDAGAGAAQLRWIRLGHATDSEIKRMIDHGISFLDIFDTAPVPAIGFITVRTGGGHAREYLRLKPGMEKAAAFLESRRYAAYLGATTQFSASEGIAFNRADKKLYLAMSKVAGDMVTDFGDIRLAEVKSGAVYELLLQANKAEDQYGDQINSEWVADSMQSLAALTGSDRLSADEYGNTADVQAIANPDNLSFSAASRYLFIGEDSVMHVNNFLWAYQIDTGQLVRLLSVPAGAEIGGLTVIDNLNGFMYILCNFQHPGAKGAARPRLEAAMERESPEYAEGRYRHAAVGYLAIEHAGPGALPWMR